MPYVYIKTFFRKVKLVLSYVFFGCVIYNSTVTINKTECADKEKVKDLKEKLNKEIHILKKLEKDIRKL